jgi:hypothetical protein
VFSRKTAERQRLAAKSPLPDLDGEVFAEVVEVDRATQARMDRIAKSWKKTKNRR